MRVFLGRSHDKLRQLFDGHLPFVHMAFISSCRDFRTKNRLMFPAYCGLLVFLVRLLGNLSNGFDPQLG